MFGKYARSRKVIRAKPRRAPCQPKGDFLMLSAVRRRLSYSNMIATMALFIALGGVAVAAGLPKNSVGPKQLKRGAVTSAKIRKQAVTERQAGAEVGDQRQARAELGWAGQHRQWRRDHREAGESSVIAETIKNSVITTNKLNNEAVTTPKLANEAVTTAKLGKGSVTLGKLADEIGPLLGTLKPGQTLRGVSIWAEKARRRERFARPLAISSPCSNHPPRPCSKKARPAPTAPASVVVKRPRPRRAISASIPRRRKQPRRSEPLGRRE